MNILFLAPRLPLPADTGGKIRTLNILRQLAKEAKVQLVCFFFNEEDESHCSALRQEGIEVTLVPGHEPSFVRKGLNALMSPNPVSVEKYNDEGMNVVLAELNNANDFDIIHIDHIHMAQYQDSFRGIPCVIDEHNVEYMILKRCGLVEKSFFKRWLFMNQAGKMQVFEGAQIKKASAFLAVSDGDKALLDGYRENGGVGCVIPNGVDTQYFKAGAAGAAISEEHAIVFTGSMDWFPNDDAAGYFCEEILPIIWKKDPGLKFYIVGKDPSANLKRLAQKESRIILTGRVDDVRPYVERSKIFVVPLRIGGGTRLKILEAMSMGKAVVSTRVGAEGIDYTEHENIAIADEPHAFADTVIDLLNGSKKRAKLEYSARAMVLEKYDWNTVGSTLRAMYKSVCANQQGR